MRKVLFALFPTIIAVLCFAGETVYVYDSGGARTPYELSRVDSVSFAEPNALSIYPTEKNMASTGGRFSVDIYTAKPWTATVSDPTAIILSKSSGKGGDTESINVSAFPNSDSHPYSETVTFKSADGTTAVLRVNVSVDNEYLDLYTVDEKGWWTSFDSYKEMPRAGGEFEVQVSSNTYWESYSYDNGVHLSQSSGKYSGTIKVTVDPNTGAYTSYKSIYFNTLGGTSKSGNIKQDGEKISVGPYSKKVPPLGDTYKIGIESNADWSVSSDKDWVMFEQIDGTLTDSIDVFVGKGDEDSESATITVVTKNGIKATCKVRHEADVVSVGPESKTIAPLGGTYKIGVESNTNWTISASEPWVTFDRTEGTLNDSILVTVGKADKDSESATITVTTSHGKQATATINKLGIVTDQCGNKYTYVKIGEQYWMAENLKCDKYDTQSEAYNASWLTNNTIPTSNDAVYTPYYTDATKATKPSYMTDAQMAKLGYLYNWAAVVGVEDGKKYGTTAFTANRQGICPNGWHIPSKAEWSTLANYIDGNDGYTDAGKKLKTTSGWYSNGNGTDTYGFAALPAGYAYGSSVYGVGYEAGFWTATPNESNSNYAYIRYLGYGYDDLNSYDYYKDFGQSVRCLKD